MNFFSLIRSNRIKKCILQNYILFKDYFSPLISEVFKSSKSRGIHTSVQHPSRSLGTCCCVACLVTRGVHRASRLIIHYAIRGDKKRESSPGPSRLTKPRRGTPIWAGTLSETIARIILTMCNRWNSSKDFASLATCSRLLFWKIEKGKRKREREISNPAIAWQFRGSIS